MLFLLKIAITPVLVAAVSLAARWWGPTVGGILMGLPWFTGPTLFVLVQDKGIDFGVGACIGIELGVACVGAFMLAYGLIAIFARWPLCLAGGMAALCGERLGDAGSRSAARGRRGGDGAAGRRRRRPRRSGDRSLLLPRPRAPPALQALPWWDIPMRMLTTVRWSRSSC